MLHFRYYNDIGQIIHHFFFVVRTEGVKIQQAVLQQAGEVPHAVCVVSEVCINSFYNFISTLFLILLLDLYSFILFHFFCLKLSEAPEPRKILQLYYFIALFFTVLSIGHTLIKRYQDGIFSAGMY